MRLPSVHKAFVRRQHKEAMTRESAFTQRKETTLNVGRPPVSVRSDAGSGIDWHRRGGSRTELSVWPILT